MAPVGTARALHLYSVLRADIMLVTVLILTLSLLAGVYSVPNVQFGSTNIIGRDTGNIEFFGGALYYLSFPEVVSSMNIKEFRSRNHPWANCD